MWLGLRCFLKERTRWGGGEELLASESKPETSVHLGPQIRLESWDCQVAHAGVSWAGLASSSTICTFLFNLSVLEKMGERHSQKARFAEN